MAQFVLDPGGLFIGAGEFAAAGLAPDFARSVDVSLAEGGRLTND
ncbi:hypothetical protein [Bradyrhizobium ottawaense]